MKTKVVVSEACDGFSIEIENTHDSSITIGEHFCSITSSEFFHFDQEDSKEGLVKVFRALGFETDYEEVY